MVSTPQHLRSVVNHDGAVILDTQRGEIWNLNPSGAFIWQKLLDGCPPEQIAVEMSRNTGHDLHTSERDLDEFIDELSKHRLCVRESFSSKGE